MEWTDTGLVLGLRRHGESSAIVEVFTRAYGRHAGLVRGARSIRLRAALQPGNHVRATWRARLENHLGYFHIEPLVLRASRCFDATGALYATQAIVELLRLFPERARHDVVYDVSDAILGHDAPLHELAADLARFELIVLRELGFGLDLSGCALGGPGHELCYVSPRSGRAVSRQAARPYASRLLALPSFLLGRAGLPDESGPAQKLEVTGAYLYGELCDAFRLTGFFLDKHVWQARRLEMPVSRRLFLKLLDSSLQ